MTVRSSHISALLAFANGRTSQSCPTATNCSLCRTAEGLWSLLESQAGERPPEVSIVSTYTQPQTPIIYLAQSWMLSQSLSLSLSLYLYSTATVL